MKEDKVEAEKIPSLKRKRSHKVDAVVTKYEETERCETTECDYSTDDESPRMIFSQTDQSNYCSEICSIRSSNGSQPALHRVEEESKARAMEDLRGKIDKRKKFLLQNQSVSLDCPEN